MKRHSADQFTPPYYTGGRLFETVKAAAAYQMVPVTRLRQYMAAGLGIDLAVLLIHMQLPHTIFDRSDGVFAYAERDRVKQGLPARGPLGKGRKVQGGSLVGGIMDALDQGAVDTVS